ncbi:hypothetical protein LCGC14_2515290 [marine sediment metagenome]|uniref:Uncharacterized protein n=1 Tax=marine sediment metagenome TaxID=412755 RepID=A0A0F9D9J6_9ZZZZ
MPRGRIVLKCISESDKLAALKSDGARLLYTWLLTHLDINGCYSADVDIVRARIMPKLNKFKWQIWWYLKDMDRVGLIVIYKVGKDRFLHVPDFVKRQPRLFPDKEAIGTIPLPTPELVQSRSGAEPVLGVSKSCNSPPVSVKRKVKVLNNVYVKETYVKFLNRRVSFTARVLALHWNTVVRKLVVRGNSGDVKCLHDIGYWLAEEVEAGKFEIGIFDRVWQWAVDIDSSKDVDRPLAVLQARLKSELGYKCKSKRILTG